jgi:geranylgeranyl diphosphate synthase type I
MSFALQEHLDASPLASPAGLADVETLMQRVAVGRFLDRAGIMVQEHLQSGGKRVRARLALAAVEALGLSRQDGIPWAAAVETLHNATLVHDDIQDGDILRRGELTLWVRHGMPQAINAGDLMLMMPTILLQDLAAPDAVRWNLALATARRAAATVRGQAEEMALTHSGRFDWKSYLHAVEGKTGQLLALPVEGAALLAGRSPEHAARLGDEFVRLGLIFQLQDDTRDLYADKGRGRGSDLREGKCSALVVAHLALHPEDDGWLVDLLRTPRERTAQAGIDRAIATFREGGALHDVLLRIERESEAVRTSPVLSQEPRLHDVALELCTWMSFRAVSHDPTP